MKRAEVQALWALLIGAGSAVLAIRWLGKPKIKVFDTHPRTDVGGKLRTESTFAFLSRSASVGSKMGRALIEEWLCWVPTSEREHYRARFRCGDDAEFTSALQELTLHQALRRQGCKLRFHPSLQGTSKQPDFLVSQSMGPEFLLEACTSSVVSSGPEHSPRSDRIRDFLHGLDLDGYLIAIDELTEGINDLPQKLLVRNISDAIVCAAVKATRDSISIPQLTTADGWRVKLTAFPIGRFGKRGGTVMQEAWSRKWDGQSYPLRTSLKKKAGRYGSQIGTPYVIAVNSSDGMLTDRDLEGTLFGTRVDAPQGSSNLVGGFWGTSTNPKHRRVSAVLFTKNLWPATLLVGQVHARLYLNPWADKPYDGVLTKLTTFTFEDSALRERPGLPLHKLLRLRLRDSSIWG